MREFSDQQLSTMTPVEIETAFNPLPSMVDRTEEMEERARGLGFSGTRTWHAAEEIPVFDESSELSTHGRVRCTEVCVCGGVARYYYVRTGFLEGHYEVDGEDGQPLKFNHGGGRGGASLYAAALAAVRGLSPKPPTRKPLTFSSSRAIVTLLRRMGRCNR